MVQHSTPPRQSLGLSRASPYALGCGPPHSLRQSFMGLPATGLLMHGVMCSELFISRTARRTFLKTSSHLNVARLRARVASTLSTQFEATEYKSPDIQPHQSTNVSRHPNYERRACTTRGTTRKMQFPQQSAILSASTILGCLAQFHGSQLCAWTKYLSTTEHCRAPPVIFSNADIFNIW